MFLLNQIIVSPFVHIFDLLSLFAAEFEEPKIGISGKWINFILSRVQHEKCITSMDPNVWRMQTYNSYEIENSVEAPSIIQSSTNPHTLIPPQP